MAQTLLERGFAYESGGCVFYNVDRDPEFGTLARAIGLNDYHPMLSIANERGNFPDDPRKRAPSISSFSNLLKEYTADAILLIILLSHHYRYPWVCFPEDLKIAHGLYYWENWGYLITIGFSSPVVYGILNPLSQ